MIKMHIDHKKENYQLAGSGELGDIIAEFGYAVGKLYQHLDEETAKDFKEGIIELLGSEDSYVWRYFDDKD